MTSKLLVRWVAGAAALALLGACSNAASTGSSGSPAASGASSSSDPFGTPNAATGTPITVGLLNIENGPVTFPGYRQGVEATIEYINQYKGGLGGHPLKLVHCETDGQPATSQRCANQLLDQKPAFIIGGADTGAPGAIPVWERANLAYVGGVPFTPVESNYKNAVTFSAVAGPDNSAAVVYAHQQGANSGTVVYTSDTQGTRSGLQVQGSMKKVGMTTVNGIPVPPTAADVSAQAATVVTQKPDMVFVNTPVGCASMLKSLNQLGFTGKIYVIDPCTDPKVIAAAGAGANNMIWGAPVDLPNSTPDSTLFMQILQKWAPTAAPTTITAMGVQAVINIQAKLSAIADSLTTDSILKAFRDGTDNTNFMSHPYTCNGQQIPGESAVCNGYQRIYQYANGKSTALGDWVDPAPAMG